MKVIKADSTIKVRIRRVTGLHFFYILSLIAQLIAFDAGKLIEPVVVMRRWVVILLMLVVVTYVWYRVQKQNLTQITLNRITFLLIATDIFVASFHVYVQRGMASKAVLLYVIPLLVAACLQRKKALIATSLFCIASYLLSTIGYFILNFNEGYKLELYGEIAFYCAILLLSSFALWLLSRPVRRR